MPVNGLRLKFATFLYSFLVSMSAYIPLTKYWFLNRFRRLMLPPILDLGCGTGLTLSYIRLPKHSFIVGLDIFKPFLSIASKTRLFKHVVLADAITTPFMDGFFNTVLCLDVVEHFPANLLDSFLNEVERVGKTVFIITPEKFKFQNFNGNPYLTHRSLVTSRYLEMRGYFVRKLYTLTFKFPFYVTELIAVKKEDVIFD